MASSLSKEQRNQLAKVTSAARAYAESAAKAALENLAVHESKPRSHMKDDAKKLRNRLRARGRALGDVLESDKSQGIARLIEMVAYENWHRLLFTRFLTENNLLITDKAHDSVPVTLADCEELAKDLGARDGQELACRFASALLPGVFRADDPALELRISIDDEVKLRNLLQDLTSDIFLATDSLGWTYQFWQADKKDKVNAGGNKIGADELPSVTQLFTEDYMVDFLLDNTLGAWWAGKVAEASASASHKVAEASAPASVSNKVAEASSLWSACTSEEECRKLASLPGIPWKYLRFIKMAEAPTPASVSNKVAEASAPASASFKVAEASSLCAFFDKDEPIANQTGDLPHWRQPGVTYFVTFRCADSLPAEKLDAWQSELSAWIAIHPEPHDDATKQEFSEKFPQQIQKWLDSGYGRCLLKNPAHQKLVQEALKHFNGTRYNLDEYFVAANHVHVLVTPCDGYELSEILHSWKSFTANKINEAEGLSGTFWQKESFDHIVRNEQTLNRFRNYIRDHDKHQRMEASATSGKQNASDEDQRLEASATFNKNQRMEFKPAAGTFEGWPKSAKELKCLDPCMGSGHFVVAMFERLVALRMAEEKLDEATAVAAVIQDNLFGLEIDPRCTQIAAFNLALAAWRRVGYCELPAMNLACSGLAPNTEVSDWLTIAGDNEKLKNGMERLYRLFENAPVLGSLINPRLSANDMYVADYHELQPLLEKALAQEARNDAAHEMAVTARGLAKAAEILAGQFTLVATNVPYIGQKKQHEILKDFCEATYPESKADLATCFLERCLDSCAAGGSTALVTPHNWLFLGAYTAMRKKLLSEVSWDFVVRLGARAFETISGEVVNVALVGLSKRKPSDGVTFAAIDVADERDPNSKSAELLGQSILKSPQDDQLRNPDFRISFGLQSKIPLLSAAAISMRGIVSGDGDRWFRQFWELPNMSSVWKPLQTTVRKSLPFGGRDQVIDWSAAGDGMLRPGTENRAYGNLGIALGQVGDLPATFYTGELYDNNTGVIVPLVKASLPALWALCSSDFFTIEVRRIDQALKVTNATFLKIPFDLAHWQKVAAEKYPHGLPKPFSSDPTQWLFNGHPNQKVAEPSTPNSVSSK